MPAATESTLERSDRPSYRRFEARVAGFERPSPAFLRVTFSGSDLHLFGTDRLDQRIKLLFPLPDIGITRVGYGLEDGDWYSSWRALPDEQRNPMRTYTVRDVRPAEGEIDIDFVVHPVDPGSTAGPAARWLETIAVGDELVIVGPDARSIHSASGIDWRPGDARELLIAGDETALPAIHSILESLSADARATVFVTVPSAADRLTVGTDARADIRWFPRDEPHSDITTAVRAWLADNGDLLASALAHHPQSLDDVDIDEAILWETPEVAAGSFYAWLAGESALIKGLRRVLVSETGIDRSRVAFMGYWRRGRAEQN